MSLGVPAEDAMDEIIKTLKKSIPLKPGEKYVVLKYKELFAIVQSESKIVAALKCYMSFFKQSNVTQEMLVEMYDRSLYDITIKTVGLDE